MGPGDEHLGRAVGLEAAKRHVEVEWIFLAELPVGGRTPLNAALLKADEVLRSIAPRDFPRQEWAESGHPLAVQLEVVEGLLGARQDELDLERLERAPAAIIDDH